MSLRKAPSYSKARARARNETDSNQHNAARIGQVAAKGAPESLLAPGLYVTATPIGNASDITLRALHILKNADAIVAEDTRVTARILAIHEIRRPLLCYNDNNAPKMRPKILERLRAGACLALVSDAGTPLVSDPGHKLVRAALAESLNVFAVPGPSAALAALSCAGIPTDRFLFAGFLPPKAGERRTALEELKAVPATLIFFEGPSRLGKTLADMAEILGDREAAVMRELTKLHEEVRRGTLPELAREYSGEQPKGEITLVVGPPSTLDPDSVRDQRKIDRLLELALPHMPVGAASALVAEATGERKNSVYERALALKR
jgi:16S rRNA (cytidine1402-2'-O)-methyltransferase